MNANNQDEVGAWVGKLIKENRLNEFYISKEWRKLRTEVLDDANNECQICKKKGRYTKANHVHHIMYVKRQPRFALSRAFNMDGIERPNLIAVCKDCHETHCHPERLRHNIKKPLTEERW